MHTVSVRVVTTVDDGMGNTTEDSSTRTVRGAMFAPEGMTESVDTRSPNLIGRASLYGAFPKLDHDDEVVHGTGCCNGAEFEHGTWSVVGGSRGWGPGMLVVPIDKAG